MQFNYQLKDIESVANQIIEYAKQETIWFFEGNLGAGKSTLIKQLCKNIGVKDPSTSPSFSIVNEYRNKQDQPVYHFDFYRINDQEEILDIGVLDFFDSGHLCFLEWGDKISHYLPQNIFKIKFQDTSSIVETSHEERTIICTHEKIW